MSQPPTEPTTAKAPGAAQAAAPAAATAPATQPHPANDPAVLAAFADLRENVIYVEDVDPGADAVPEEEDSDEVTAPTGPTEEQLKVHATLDNLLAGLDGQQPGSDEFIDALDNAVTGIEILINEQHQALEDLGPSETEQAVAKSGDLDEAQDGKSMLDMLEETLEVLHTFQSVQWGLGGSLGDPDDDDETEDVVGTFDATGVDYFIRMESGEEPIRKTPNALRASATANLPKTAKWAGELGYENLATGDGRKIVLGALKWDDPVGPLRYASSDFGAHEGAQVVGRILTLERRDNGAIWGTGDIDMGSEHGREAYRVIKMEYTNGVSLDLDDVSFEVRAMPKPAADAPAPKSPSVAQKTGEVELAEDGSKMLMKVSPTDEMTVTTEARIRAATLLAIPAFASARIYIVEEDGQPVQRTMGVVKDSDEDETSEGAVVATKFSAQTASASADVYLDVEDHETDWATAREYLADFADSDEDDDPDDEDDEEFAKKKGNWVSRAGGLPRYIKRISKHLRKKGMTEGHAIATAVNVVKRMCASGDLNYPGKQNANPISRAKACAAVAEWEAKKKAAKANSADTATFKTQAEYDESKHKRAKDGRFTEKDGGGSSGRKSASSSTSSKSGSTSTSKTSGSKKSATSSTPMQTAKSATAKTPAAPVAIPQQSIPDMMAEMLSQAGWEVKDGKMVAPANGYTGEEKRINKRSVKFKVNTKRIPVKRVKPVKAKKKKKDKKKKSAKAKTSSTSKTSKKKAVDMSWHVPPRKWKKSTKSAARTLTFRGTGRNISVFAEQPSEASNPAVAVDTFLGELDELFDQAGFFPDDGVDSSKVNQWYWASLETVGELFNQEELMADPSGIGFQILEDRLITAQEMLMDSDFELVIEDGEPTPEMQPKLIATTQQAYNLFQSVLDQISPPDPEAADPKTAPVARRASHPVVQ